MTYEQLGCATCSTPMFLAIDSQNLENIKFINAYLMFLWPKKIWT
jgi:hypothetical protein